MIANLTLAMIVMGMIRTALHVGRILLEVDGLKMRTIIGNSTLHPSHQLCKFVYFLSLRC
jgi:hypothetical protein